MTDNEFDQYISEVVSKVVQDNMLQILETLTKITGESTSSVQNTALAFASITLATKLSTRISFEVLKKFEILNLSDFDFIDKSPDLKIILGNLTHDISDE